MFLEITLVLLLGVGFVFLLEMCLVILLEISWDL